jgi:hypothetical protein
MLLQINTPTAASDLGYLLYKNPARLHSFELRGKTFTVHDGPILP